MRLGILKKQIKKTDLDIYNYTVSLLEEGLRLEFIEKEKIDDIKDQIMLILKDLIIRYTKGESSSVKTSTAENILKSIFYSLDALTSSFEDPQESLALLQTKKITRLYEQGIQQITAAVIEAKALFKKIKKNRLEVPLELYNAAIDEDIPGFFQNYGIVFNAHDTMCTLDYPLAFDDMKIQGIFYIKQYLEKLDIETQFCHRFNLQDIKQILANCGRIYRINYKKSPINIFELLINNSIFSKLLGNEATKVIISKFESQLLQRRLEKLNTSEINILIDIMRKEIIKDLSFEKPSLIDYIQQYLPILTTRILHTVKNDGLQNLILSDPPKNSHDEKIVFVSTDKMRDDSFRFLIQKILTCKNSNEKVELIRSKIFSWVDFTDLLTADCLFDNDFTALYNKLSDLELATLGKMLFLEELRTETFSKAILQKKVNIEWQIYFVNFLKKLKKNRLIEVEKYIMLLDDNTFQ